MDEATKSKIDYEISQINELTCGYRLLNIWDSDIFIDTLTVIQSSGKSAFRFTRILANRERCGKEVLREIKNTLNIFCNCSRYRFLNIRF